MGKIVISNSTKAAAILLSFYTSFVFFGLMFSFAEYFEIIVEAFDSNYATIAYFATSVAGFSKFAGTLPTVALEKFGYPICFGAATILLAAAFFITSYDVYTAEFFFSYTILFSISLAFLMQFTQTVLYDVFDQSEIGFAFGASITGAGFGIMGFSCFAAYYSVVNDILSWRELFRYYSLIGFSLVFVALLAAYCMDEGVVHRHQQRVESELDSEETARLHQGHTEFSAEVDERTPLRSRRPEASAEEPSHGDMSDVDQKNTILFGWDRFFSGDTEMIVLFISNFFLFMPDMVPMSFAIIYATSSDSTDDSVYYYVPIALGMGVVVIGPIFSYLINFTNPMVIVKILQIGLISTTAVLAILPSSNLVGVLITLGVFAGLNSSLFALFTLRTTYVLGDYEYKRNYGVVLYSQGFAAIVGGMFGGLIYDQTYDFYWVFLYCSLAFVFSLLFDEFLLTKSSCLHHAMSVLSKSLC
jgi:MFS family permease